MIPQEFQDYFKTCSKEVQQSTIESLLGFMDSSSTIKSTAEDKAIICPHCSSKKIRANGKLKQVQRYVCNDCKRNFSETTGKVWYNQGKRI